VSASVIKLIRVIFCLSVLSALLLTAKPLRMEAADEWQPINPADLALKDNPASPGADAMILYHESVVSLKELNAHGDSDMEYDRIKIFTDAGKEYANVEVPYVAGDSGDYSDWDSTTGAMQILAVRGRTIHPDGTISKFDGKVYEKMLVKRGGLKVRAATFTMPDVQPGCIIEYKYVKQGEPGWLHAEEWTVSQEIFTREAHFTFIPPTEYTGYVPYYRLYGLGQSAMPKCDQGVDHECVMEADNIPAVIDEALMPPKKAVESRVEWYFQRQGEAVSQTPEQYWNRMGKRWNGELEKFLDKKGELAQEVSKTLSPGDPPDVKLWRLYKRAQQIQNTSFGDEKTKQELKVEKAKKNGNVEDVLKDGHGSSREINFLFVGLARAAGFEATEVYVAPRNRELFLPQQEDAEQLTANVAWVKAGDKDYYLDPGAKFFAFGVLPWYESETSGEKLSKDGAQTVQTPRTEPGQARLTRRADLKIGEDGSVEGQIQVAFTGEQSGEMRRRYYKEDEAGRKKEFEDEIKTWLPGGTAFEITSIENWDDVEKPLQIEGTLKVAGMGSVTGHRMLMPADFFASLQAAPFKPEKRINAVYFTFPFEESDDLTFHVPAGFKVEAAPKTQSVHAGAVLYDLAATQGGESVEIKRSLTVNGVAFSREAYATLRTFFNLARTYDNGEIVFENVATTASN
jgi:hypothetical protein